MPYTYSIAREAVDGKPMIRAMFLDDPNPYTLGTATRYQFLYGPYVLVAPSTATRRPTTRATTAATGSTSPKGTGSTSSPATSTREAAS